MQVWEVSTRESMKKKKSFDTRRAGVSRDKSTFPYQERGDDGCKARLRRANRIALQVEAGRVCQKSTNETRTRPRSWGPWRHRSYSKRIDDGSDDEDDEDEKSEKNVEKVVLALLAYA